MFLLQAMALLTFCYFGNRVTTKPMELIAAIYNSAWYEWPLKYRQELMMMVRYGRREFYFSAYGIIRCSLNTYQNLMNKVGSYFIILRSMS